MIVNQLVGSLVGKYSGPVLVVGGAPSLPGELAALAAAGFDLRGCLVISANEHAVYAGLTPDYACVNDDIHHTLGVHQEPRMRELMPETKLLSRHWWADYRSPQLMACNSGLKAILYAAILGANPVIVVGIQHYREGLYFHEENNPRKKSNPNMARDEGYFQKQTKLLHAKLRGVPVRTVSGPLTKVWPKWNPEERFEPRPLGDLESKARKDAQDTRYVHVRSTGFGFEGALVPEGMVFALTRGEQLSLGHCQDIDDATDWDLSDKNAALARQLEANRAEQTRLRLLIGKLRASRRGISRSIYDADIVRVIKWVEGGHEPVHIAKRTGLPVEQVLFMVGVMGLTAA